MKFDLLLLFALVGYFCTITHASTLVVPTEAESAQVTGAFVPTEASETFKEEEAAPDKVVTEAPASAATEPAVENGETPSPHTEVAVEETVAPSVDNENQTEQTETLSAHSEAPVEEKETPVGVTEAPAETTEAAVVTEDTTATEGTPKVTEAADEAPKTGLQDTSKGPKTEPESGQMIETDQVEVEDSEGMSTGHVVGIVFGALVAVVIIIAVIVVVVRRMGQYTTGKKQKPLKQDGLSLSVILPRVDQSFINITNSNADKMM
ncbi:uncharacterized protein si:ch211-156j16.1 isoform X1 [Pangasianodon hypophthalmus]|uniref:uncharacterized protein si:ch211-156j16.1 isoform X1 n=1 Tax=Pangasianodon hypophthalmus TaxID=310915 RepID=UPI0023081301|nr:uncharacterized protein si:ch211-156j16.1 isoform X1 [Pangasianodon hypophthalmus]